jgi:hypothetical protein
MCLYLARSLIGWAGAALLKRWCTTCCMRRCPDSQTAQLCFYIWGRGASLIRITEAEKQGAGRHVH